MEDGEGIGGLVPVSAAKKERKNVIILLKLRGLSCGEKGFTAEHSNRIFKTDGQTDIHTQIRTINKTKLTIINLKNEYVGNKESCQRENLHGVVIVGEGVRTEI
mgnify:FL=1